jgi:hypothetical protein
LVQFSKGLGFSKSMFSVSKVGHSAENVEFAGSRRKSRSSEARASLQASLKHHCSLLQSLHSSSKRVPAWQRRTAHMYNKEPQWLIQRSSVVAQLSKHRRTPLQARGPRGPTDSYFRAWAGFHSDSSQFIISARRGLALMMLQRWNIVGKRLNHSLRSVLSSERLPSPPTAFRPLLDPKASSQ